MSFPRATILLLWMLNSNDALPDTAALSTTTEIRSDTPALEDHVVALFFSSSNLVNFRIHHDRVGFSFSSHRCRRAQHRLGVILFYSLFFSVLSPDVGFARGKKNCLVGFFFFLVCLRRIKGKNCITEPDGNDRARKWHNFLLSWIERMMTIPFRSVCLLACD